MKSIRDLVAEHPFFTGLPTTDLDLISGCGINVVFRQDETVFREAGPADHFYLLRTGRVALELDVAPKPPFVVTTLAAGDVLGASWLSPPYQWQFDALALEDTSAVAVDAVCLRAKCHDDPALGFRLMERFAALVAERLHATRLRLLDVYGDA